MSADFMLGASLTVEYGARQFCEVRHQNLDERIPDLVHQHPGGLAAVGRIVLFRINILEGAEPGRNPRVELL